MEINVGSLDRAIRLFAGLMILSVWFVAEGPVRWVALIGLLPIATSVLAWCPAYLPFGISTVRWR